ncbi:DNRLRE domain-containing protein [Tuwongella immobilis]|uniref:Uncharacterized protein n=1 Tax=Tuwongella immobilis TaxID=692036 RepID=A0A6C2YPX7_9BACT|nr:DNRLRE domain-containing protein [Tuwongella immobilis]VIP03688.1 autotransporter adhesin : Uncharacterized protein OS=Magnetospirillum gryphiswaldense MSR-1 v2 GN=MGMSRv2__0576 PE=4 SV=1: VCBS [Tuwongella immobilis]VTS04744.1 autotransporter adhesin : Uncharacterized protein OS=Magnetospirillum gryphiswaldense MSR-1 v2 GN=MGMSRv2__0576 PE=4 SV=1: VCBS [Tuwongella immobilis]
MPLDWFREWLSGANRKRPRSSPPRRPNTLVQVETLESRAVPATLSFREGIAGYTGTQDTFLDQNNPTANNGATTTVQVGQTAGAANRQTLIRFDNLFGLETDAGKIPFNAKITKAVLSFQVDTPGPGAAVHDMLVNWNESSTWNSLTNGLEPGTDVTSLFGAQAGLASLAKSFGANTAMDVDVTTSLRNWLNGAADATEANAKNLGWGLLPWTSGNNSLGLRSSESTSSNRPVLTVSFERAETTVVSFQQGVNGYTGVLDTMLSSKNASTVFEAATALTVAASPPSPSDQYQSLIRFNGVEAAIPSNSKIYRAFLVFETTGSGGGSGFNLHELFVNFDKNSTFNSLGGGINLAGTEYNSVPVATFGSASNANHIQDGQIVRLDVTSSVQNWSNGVDNKGWVLLPLSNGTNDWSFFSSEDGKGPRLEIVYSTPPNLTGATSLTSIPEDLSVGGIAVANDGTSITDLLTPVYSDGDSTINPGVAITQVNNTNGVWQFTADGIAWNAINIPTGKVLVLDGTVGSTAKVRFVPSPNFFGNVQGLTFFAWDQFVTAKSGSYVDLNSLTNSLSASTLTANIVVNPVPDIPTVVEALTSENTTTTDGLQISRAGVDKGEVTHFQITWLDPELTGKLYTKTLDTNGKLIIDQLLSNGDFIDATIASYGLAYEPNANTNGLKYFYVAGSLNDLFTVGDKAKAQISVFDVADQPQVVSGPPSTLEDTSTIIQIDRNSSDSVAVGLFQIGTVSNGYLEFTATKGKVPTGTFIPLNEAQAGLRFVPDPDFFGNASFTIRTAISPSVSSLGPTLFVNIPVAPVADTPTAPDVTAPEDTVAKVVVTRYVNDGAEVNNLRITNTGGGFSSGKLYRDQALTQLINPDDVIAFDDALDGLFFVPNTDFVGVATFEVQAGIDGVFAGKIVPVDVTFIEQAEAPVAIVTSPIDEEGTGTIQVSPNPAETVAVTHFRITSPNVTFSLVRTNNIYTLAEAASLGFTGNLDFFGNAVIQVQAATGPNLTDLSGPVVNVPLVVNPIADTPVVVDARALLDTQTTSGLEITPNPVDGATINFFYIDNITNGTLFQNDGVTAITNGTWISLAQGAAGLRFTPTTGFIGLGSFTIAASPDTDLANASSIATATIAIGPDFNPPTITPVTIAEDTPSSPILIVADPGDPIPAPFYQIVSVTNGTLYLRDGVTVVNPGDFVTAAQATVDGLIFRPDSNFFGTANFEIAAAVGTLPVTVIGLPGTGTITVDPIPDAPTITPITVVEDSGVSTSRLVVTPSADDLGTTTHYLVVTIDGGTLYLADGVTVVSAGTFITVADGTAGLRFQPEANFFGTATFTLLGSTSATLAGVATAGATGTILVTPVADPGSTFDYQTVANTSTGPIIRFLANPVDGASITHFQVLTVQNGTLLKADGTPIVPGSFITFAEAQSLQFLPTTGFLGFGVVTAVPATAADPFAVASAASTSFILVNPAPVVPPLPPVVPPPGQPRPNATPGWHVTGAGPGGGPQVNLYDTTSGNLVASFNAYESSFTGGVRVALGDVNGDGVRDIITAAGFGGGPLVRVFDGATLQPILNFFAYEDSFRGGAYVAAADLDGDGRVEIITGVGDGGGPLVKIFNGLTGAPIGAFFAYDSNFRGGVNVAAGDLDGDGKAEIVVGAGIGGGPHVQVLDGTTFTVRSSFFAYDPSFRGGTFVAIGDVTGDFRGEIITGPGFGGGPDLRIYREDGFLLRNRPIPSDNVGTPNTGLRVSISNTASGSEQIFVSTGVGGSSIVRVFQGSTLEELRSFDPYPGFLGGVYLGGD